MDDTAAATSLPAAVAAADGAAAHPGDSVSFTIPRKSGVAIYFPGYINPESPAAALSTLGGEPGLSAALSEQPAYLKLRLRPDDPYSHPLFGERVPQAGLLLRIARPKGQPDAAPSVTCVSRVSATYAYNGMADYQYLGHDPEQYTRHLSQQQQQQQQPMQLSQPNLPLAAEPRRQPGPFLLLPPLFSKMDMPVAYGFKDTAAAAAGAGEENAAKPRSKDEPEVINFYDGVPPPALPLNPEYLTPQQQQQLPRLQALLQQRPAWHMEMLLSQLPGLNEEALKPLLVALCYQFKTGPWKSLWIACGVDPRGNSDSRRYQNIYFRQPAEWAKAVKAAKQAGRPLKQPSLAAMCCFTALPVSYNTPLQLCDLQDEAIRQLMSSAPVTNTPSEAYGWFTYASTQQMQQALSMAFGKALPQALAQLQQQQQEVTEAGDQMEMDSDQQQQQYQQQDIEAAAAATGAAAAGQGASRQQQEGRVAAPPPPPPPAAAAAAAELGAEAEPEAEGEDLVGMLGLDADEDLRQFLRDAAAAAGERQRLRAAAAAAASGATATAAAAGADVGLSGSEWEATSGAETTEGEDDGLTSEGDWGTDGEDEDEGGDGLEAYNEDV